MTSTFPLYLIPLLPLLGAALNLLLGRKLPRRLVHFLACSAVLAAFAVALWATLRHLYPQWRAAAALGESAIQHAPALTSSVFDWISAGNLSVQVSVHQSLEINTSAHIYSPSAITNLISFCCNIFRPL